MRIIVEGFATLSFIAGLLLAGMAVLTPRRYDGFDLSAIQMTQVYSEATFYAVLAVAAFAGGCFLMLALRRDSE